MEKRKVVFEFEDCKDGSTKCTAMGTVFKFDDLEAIHNFCMYMMNSFVDLHKACFEQKYGEEIK